MPDHTPLSFAKIQAAMKAMTDKATQTPDQVVAIAIADSTGNLLAYAQTGNLRLFSRRHAIRKAYTAAVMATDTGTNGKNPLNDLRVRKAISKAINRDAIVARVMEGVAIPAG